MLKSIVAEKIRSIIKDRDEQLDWLGELEKQQAEAVALLKDIETQITEAGKPSFRDRVALDNLDSLKRQKEACTAAIKQNAGSLNCRGRIVNCFSREGFEAIVDILRDAREKFVEATVKQFEPYFVTTERALHFASNTDAAISTTSFIESLNEMTSHVQHREANDGQSLADQVEQLMKEALKKEPDFEQYFRPYYRASHSRVG